MPAYVAFQRSRSHIAYAGYLGKQYDPFLANDAAKLPIYDLVGKDTGKFTTAGLFQPVLGLNVERLTDRKHLLGQLDRKRKRRSTLPKSPSACGRSLAIICGASRRCSRGGL